jgi:hypothetical protein
MRRLIVLGLLLGSLAPGQPAVAQGPDSTPSARELWKSYPLERTLEPTPEPDARRVDAVRTSAPTPRPAQSSGSGSSIVVAAILLIVAFAIGFALAVRPPALLSRRRAKSAPEPVPAGRPTLEPPARGRPWSAEIEWHAASGEGRFRAVARAEDGREETILLESPSLEWPPTAEESVPTLARAAEELERRLIEAGWKPLPPGDAWYAKRFIWEPALWMPHRRFEPSGPKEKVT